MTFGETLRAARKAKGKSLLEVSFVLQCSTAYLSDVERGRRAPLSGLRLLLAARVLGISPGELTVPAVRERGEIIVPPDATDEQIRAAVTALWGDEPWVTA